MNWDNKELNAMIDTVLDPNAILTPEMMRAYLRYAYVLGKSDGYTNGVLAMSPKRAEKVA